MKIGWAAAFAATALLAGCASAPTLEERYLDEINAVNPEAFVSDRAALGYLKNYCEAMWLGSPPPPDAVDKIVATYCDTDLAAQVGVSPPPSPPPASIDLEAFRERALSEFGIGAPLEDGSVENAVSSAQMICMSDPASARQRLGADWEGSFQQLAIETFCPEAAG